MKLQPKHCTFSQAKLLIQKGIDIESNTYYDSQGIACYSLDVLIDWPYTVIKPDRIYRPEQHQIVEALWEKYQIWISVQYLKHTHLFYYDVNDLQSKDYFKTPEDAYSFAIDYVLTNMI